MLNVICAECREYAYYVECHYAECRYAECHAECRGAYPRANFIKLFTAVSYEFS